MNLLKKQSHHIFLVIVFTISLITPTSVFAEPFQDSEEIKSARVKLDGVLSSLIVTSVTCSDANPTNADTVSFTVTFSASVIDVNLGNFTLTTTGVTGASVLSMSGSGSTYIVLVNTGTGDGTIQLNVLDNDNIEDVSGNYFDTPFSGSEAYIIEKTGPTIASITLPDTNPNDSDNVSFIVVFSKPVIDVSISDFTLTTTGVSGASVSSMSGSGDTYTVIVNSGTGDGTIQLNVIDNDSIEDVSGNYFDTPFSSGEQYAIKKVRLVVSSITLADANPTSDENVSFTVTFSAPVIDVSISAFTLTTTGVSGASVTSISGSGDTYTVIVNSGSGAGTIQLNVIDNDTIEDIEGNFFDTPASSSEVYTIEETENIIITIFDLITDFFRSLFSWK